MFPCFLVAQGPAWPVSVATWLSCLISARISIAFSKSTLQSDGHASNRDLRRFAAYGSPMGAIWVTDPATHTHCTFGGMLGNNSCGVHSQVAGKAVDNVSSMNSFELDRTIASGAASERSTGN
jgi:FAD/FMN-containing dehydrogenase